MTAPSAPPTFLRSQWVLPVLVLVITLATLPRLVVDYGRHYDSRAGVQAAERLFHTGVYQPSRLPGNPLFEYLLALLVPWGGHIASNLLVLAFYALGVYCFSQLARARPDVWLLTALFALTPILLVNAATTKDYVGGLALILASYLLAVRGRTSLAALFAALAIGFRLPNLLFLLPLGLYLHLTHIPVRRGALLMAGSLLLGLLFYLPIYASVGPAMFELPPSLHRGLEYLIFTSYTGLQFLGPLASAALLLLLLLHRAPLAASLRAAFSPLDPSFVVELVAVALFGGLFLLHSDEAAYLLPILPFLYLWLGRWFPRRSLALFTLLVFSFGLITLNLKGGESGRRSISFEPAPGVLIQDYQDRVALEELRRHIGDFHLSNRAVILTAMGPNLVYQNPALVPAAYSEISPRLDPAGIRESYNLTRLAGRDVFLVYSLSLPNVELLRAEGYDLYIFSEFAPSIALNTYGYDPYAIGFHRLDILNDHPFYTQP